jgi:hypothetical protein
VIKEPLKLDASLADTYREAQAFVRKVGSAVNSTAPPDNKTWRYVFFVSAMDHAEADAEEQIRQIPPDERSAGMDHLDLRRFAIANLQSIRALAFLRAEKEEVEKHLLSQRSNIYEQHKLRNPDR